MADSSYYKDMYKQKKKAVDNYEDNLKDLRKAYDNLTDTMGDEIRAVNNELDDLKSDLEKSIRHNGPFSSGAGRITGEKEQGVTADSKLSVAVRELEEEIARIGKLKSTAEQDRDYYDRKYKEKKDEEREAFWKNLF